MEIEIVDGSPRESFIWSALISQYSQAPVSSGSGGEQLNCNSVVAGGLDQLGGLCLCSGGLSCGYERLQMVVESLDFTYGVTW